jgi:predicted porin
MKKSLIALAVLAASGAAMAQSSVTLYGIADAWVGSTKVETGAGFRGPLNTPVAATGSQRQTAVNTSGVNGSRWGLKGSEDLGGGMNAIFTLESGFSLDTGASAQNGTLFSRQAFVGLQSGFGTVSLGRQYSAYDNLQGAVNNNYDAFTFNARTGANGGVAANGIKDYTNRIDNSIAYTSPSFGGFSGAVVYGFGENKNTAANVNGDATDNASVHVKYANGPILVGYAYQEEKLAAVAGAQDKNKYNLLGGSYDFGVAKLTGSYNTAKNNLLKDKEGQIGVSVPFGAAAISVGLARSKSEGAGVERTGKGISLLGTYALSKRTGLYFGAQQTKAFVPTAASAATFTSAAVAAANLSQVGETKTTTYGLGVRHSF